MYRLCSNYTQCQPCYERNVEWKVWILNNDNLTGAAFKQPINKVKFFWFFHFMGGVSLQIPAKPEQILRQDLK